MKSLFVSFIILTIFLTGCKSGSSYTAKKFKETYTVDVGQEFIIGLRSHLNNGYLWKWDNVQTVEVIDSISWHYITLNTNLTDVGGTEKWRFKGIKSGEDSIKLHYIACETNVIVDSINIVIQVK